MLEKATMLKGRNLAKDAPFHMPPPALPINAQVRLALENVSSDQAPEIVLRDSRRDFEWRIEMKQEGEAVYAATVRLPLEPTIVHYYFQLPDGTKIQETRQVEGHNTPIFNEYTQQDFKIGVYDPTGMPPEWSQGMVIYQIFPDSFAKGNDTITRPQYGPYGHELLIKEWGDNPELPPVGRDFYGGDLKGVTEKLDYLKELNVECIYFCPIFKSPTNHRYDAIDYMQIDPMLGTEEDFKALIDAAHKRGIKIVLDAVYNHCSCDSIYFDMPNWADEGAYHSKQSPYYRWFNFTDYPKEYQTWEGFANMPEFVECPEVEDFFLGENGVTAYWTKLGVDGWRTDVTGCNTDTFWRRFRHLLNTIQPENYTVSEEWGDASHYLMGDMFSATMNYRFAWSLIGFFGQDQINASQFDDRLATLRRDTPPTAILAQMNLLDSHDTARILTQCNEEKFRLKQIVAFQMAYPGAPMIYYGDEAGLLGKDQEDGRKAFPWGEEDRSLLDFYKRVTTARSKLPALRTGEYETLVADDEARLLVFVRRLEGEKPVYAAYNASDSPAEITIPVPHSEEGKFKDTLEICEASKAEDGALTVQVGSRSMGWFVKV